MNSARAFATVEEYLASLPIDARAKLEAIRLLVRTLVPEGEERISYGMPAIFWGGVVVYYAAFKKHIGLYPPVKDPTVLAHVARYAGPKGNLKFPLSEPLPLAMIEAVVRSRLAEISADRHDLDQGRSRR